jgi:hypothetical protein
MHHQPQTDHETAAAMRCGVDKLVFRGVNRRTAVRRVARRTRIDPRQAGYLIAHGGGLL